MSVTWVGSFGRQNFDSPISEFKYLATRTIFKDPLLASMIIRLINGFPFVC